MTCGYGPDELKKVGQALFGTQWQSDLARALGLSDARRVRQWLTGDRPIPLGVWGDLCLLLRERQQTIEEILDAFDARIEKG